MLHRMFGSRAFVSFGMVVVLVLAAVAGFKLLNPTPKMQTYCALMPDSIGLFEGSAVTVLGIQQGSITKIEPVGAQARVEFLLPADRALPTDVGATSVSDTLIADRRLAIIGAEPDGPGWDAAQCITKTLTPKSLTQTFAAVAKLADELNGAGDPGRPNLVKDSLAAIDTATDGTAPEVNKLIHNLGAALNSPDAAIGHLGAIVNSLAALLESADRNWGDIKLAITRMAEMLYDMTERALPPVLETILKLQDLLPMLNDLTIMFGGPLLRRLNAVENLPQLLSSGVAGLRDVIAMIPTLTDAFTGAIDPQTRRVTLAYAPPRVEIPAPDAARMCAAVNAIAPGRCADNGKGMATVDLARLVLGSVGAR